MKHPFSLWKKKKPDSQVISIHNEWLYSPERLFQPSVQSIESSGIYENPFSSIKMCDMDIHIDPYANTGFWLSDSKYHLVSRHCWLDAEVDHSPNTQHNEV